MPIDEFYGYIELLNKEIERRNNKETPSANEVQERKKTIGELLPKKVFNK